VCGDEKQQQADQPNTSDFVSEEIVSLCCFIRIQIQVSSRISLEHLIQFEFCSSMIYLI
jgi:hypothetical protein